MLTACMCIPFLQWINALECDVLVVFDKNDMERVSLWFK